MDRVGLFEPTTLATALQAAFYLHLNVGSYEKKGEERTGISVYDMSI